MTVDIGLTGNIASGKSMVASIMRELGAGVVDADLIGKQVLAANIDGSLDKVRAAFGDQLFEGGQLNRHALGNLVFSNSSLLEQLNSITVPVMTRLVAQQMDALHATFDVVVLDAAILIEAGWQELVDEVWVVRASKNEQLQRLMTRDHLPFGEAMSRIEAQMPLKSKLSRADVVIDNTTDIEATRRQVEALWKTRLQNR